MNSYEIIRAISAVETMTYAEKFAGAILALHLDRAKGFIKVRQSVIAEECGLTVRVVQSSVKKMISGGIFEAKRTPRALILKPLPSVKKSVKKHMNARAYHRRTDMQVTNAEGYDPFNPDTTLSSMAEERGKVEQARFLRELEKTGSNG